MEMMKFTIFVIWTQLICSSDLVFRDAGISLKKKPLTKLVTHFEMPVNYLIIYRNPHAIMRSTKEIRGCQLSETKQKKLFEIYENNIRSTWSSMLDGSSQNIRQGKKRSKRGVMSGIISTSQAAIISMFAMSHFHQSSVAHYSGMIHKNSEVLTEHTKLFKAILAEDKIHRDHVNQVLCDMLNTINFFAVENYLNSRAKIIKNSIITGVSNKLPKKSKDRLRPFQNLS